MVLLLIVAWLFNGPGFGKISCFAHLQRWSLSPHPIGKLSAEGGLTVPYSAPPTQASQHPAHCTNPLNSLLQYTTVGAVDTTGKQRIATKDGGGLRFAARKPARFGASGVQLGLSRHEGSFVRFSPSAPKLYKNNDISCFVKLNNNHQHLARRLSSQLLRPFLVAIDLSSVPQRSSYGQGRRRGIVLYRCTRKQHPAHSEQHHHQTAGRQPTWIPLLSGRRTISPIRVTREYTVLARPEFIIPTRRGK